LYSKIDTSKVIGTAAKLLNGREEIGPNEATDLRKLMAKSHSEKHENSEGAFSAPKSATSYCTVYLE
jgi:hypothetical protein